MECPPCLIGSLCRCIREVKKANRDHRGKVQATGVEWVFPFRPARTFPSGACAVFFHCKGAVKSRGAMGDGALFGGGLTRIGEAGYSYEQKPPQGGVKGRYPAVA